MGSFARARGVRPWLVAAGAVVASGCATLTGLDQYEKADGEAPDVTTDQTVPDSGKDSPASETSSDVQQPDVTNDVVVSDAQDSGASDAPFDGDCGPLNTVNNCTACGATCDGTNSSNTQCNGTTCQYTCKQGFSNCSNNAPDLNGCECATPSCCGSSCATTHDNGVGQHYYDCVDAGTYTSSQALKACTAYTNDQLACQAASCIGDAGDLVVCGAPDGGGCACWDYTGTDTAHVYKAGSTTCFCPSTNDPTWN